MAFIGLYYLGLFINLRTDTYSSVTEGEVMLTGKFEHFSQFCGPCVGSSENQNVTDTQNKFLLCRWKLGIIVYLIQEFIKEKKMEDTNLNKVVLPPVILPKLKSTCPWKLRHHIL